MSVFEVAPPPPRPPPPTSRNTSKFSMDLEGMSFDDSTDSYDTRRRSMTLGSRPAPRPHNTDKPVRMPHVIDSSGRSPRTNTKTEHVIDTSNIAPKTDSKTERNDKSSAPAPKPDRPPPPQMIRSVSQPSSVVTRTQSAPDEGVAVQNSETEVKGGSGGVMLRKRLGSDGSINTNAQAAKRLSSPRRSKEMSPLPQLPEDSSANINFTSRQAISPISTVPPRYTPPPPAPRRPRSVSSPDRATPPSVITESNADMPSKPTSPTRTGTQLSPSHLATPTPDDISVKSSEDAPLQTGNQSDESAPVVPPRPFRPPRPYPPNGTTQQKKPPGSARRPISAPPTKLSVNPPPPQRRSTQQSPVRPSRRSPRHIAKVKAQLKQKEGEGSPAREKMATSHPATTIVSDNPALDQDSVPVNADTTGQLASAENEKSETTLVDVVDEPHDRQSGPSPIHSDPSPIHSPPTSPSSPSSASSAGGSVSPVTAKLVPTELPGSRGGGARQVKFIDLSRQMSSDNEDEKEDQVPVLSQSFPSKGRKMMASMKNSFKSIRIKRKPSEMRPKRTASDSSSFSSSSSSDRQRSNYPDPLPPGMIHPIVIQCVAYLNRESVLVEEGLFRVPGDLATIRRLRQDFTDGYEVDLMEVLDPHTVAGLLKLHFREMKTSLVPRGLSLNCIMAHVKNKDVGSLCGEFEKIEVVNVATLSVVIEVLAKITSHSAVNHMSSGVLATSCGPSLFPYLPPSNANQMTKFLIDNYTNIFFKSIITD